MSARWEPVRPAPGGPAGAPGAGPGTATTSSRGVQGWAAKNKVTLGAGAVGLVVVVALLTRGKGSSDSSTPTGTVVSGTTAGQNTGAYDSSAADTYNALQPEIEGLRNILESWQAQQVPVPGATNQDVATPVTTTPTSTTVPVSTTVPTGTYTAQQVQDIFKSPVGSQLASQGILPPSDSGASNSQAQANYGKSYEAAWEAKYGMKK